MSGFRIDLITICTILALSESARGVVLSTINLYVTSLHGSTFELSVAISLFSVGRLVASLWFGYYLSYFNTETSTNHLKALIHAMYVVTIGHFFYLLASVSGLWLLFIARL